MNFKDIIVAAANIYNVYDKDGVFVGEITLVDNCHMGRNMHSVTQLLKQQGYSVKLATDKHPEDRAQGFINQNGEFFNRSESYKIAISSGQPFNNGYTLPDNKLDSSCIRHFDVSKPLEYYIPEPEFCCMRYAMMYECDCDNKGLIGYNLNGEKL